MTRTLFTVLFVCLLVLPRVSPAASGDLDISFGTDGKVLGSGSANFSSIGGMAVQEDGKIIRAGMCFGDAGITRYNPDGTIDTETFNPLGPEPGTVTVDLLGTGSPEDVITSVAVQADHKIVVAGYSHDGPPFLPNHFVLVRLNEDGSLDATGFGNGGRVATVISGGEDDPNAVAIQSDGKILAAGFASTNGIDFALVRYNGDGSLDTTFNASGSMPGVVTTDFTGSMSYERAYGMALQEDGKIILVGISDTADESGFTTTRMPASDFNFAAARYNADGTLDVTFNAAGLNPGTVTTDTLGVLDQANAVAVEPDGRIVLAGQTEGNTFIDFAMVRYLADGTLDTSFNPGGLKPGVATSDFSGNGSTEYANAVAVQPDGKILAAGLFQEGMGNIDFAVARYGADGVLDPSFGTGGLVLTDFGPDGSDSARGVFVLSDGKILVGGDGGLNDFALARYIGNEADLSLDQTVDAASVFVGDDVTYTITVTNLGSDAATGVTLTDDPPVGLTLVSATASAGTCAAGVPVRCSLGAIDSGASLSVTLVMTPPAAGTFTNAASVSGLIFDPDTGNNGGSAPDVVAVEKAGTGTGTGSGTGSGTSSESTGSGSGGCSLIR